MMLDYLDVCSFVAIVLIRLDNVIKYILNAVSSA